MIKQTKRICTLLLGFLCLSSFPAFCAADDHALKLEKALMKYILSYEALQKAKQNPKQRKKLPKFIKKHREAYAQYTQLLRESDLYNPTEEDNDPAGKYNKKSTNKKKKWKTVDTKSHRDKIKDSVESGKEPEEISNEVEASLPTQAFSEDENPSFPNLGNIITSSNNNDAIIITPTGEDGVIDPDNYTVVQPTNLDPDPANPDTPSDPYGDALNQFMQNNGQNGLIDASIDEE